MVGIAVGVSLGSGVIVAEGAAVVAGSVEVGVDRVGVIVSTATPVGVTEIGEVPVAVNIGVGVLVADTTGPVLVGTLGTLNTCPALMTLLVRQLARINSSGVTR